MKKGNLLAAILIVACIGLLSFSFTNENQAPPTDDNKNEIVWTAYKVGGSHTGTIDLKEGGLNFESGALTGGSFTIDMNSIACTDLEGEWKGKLEGHLKSADFFSVSEFPTASFNITKVVEKGTPGDYKITGDLTIKGITKTIKFYANVKEDGGHYYTTAKIEVDRSDFDVKYGSASFFDNLKDKTIHDEFELSINLVSHDH